MDEPDSLESLRWELQENWYTRWNWLKGMMGPRRHFFRACQLEVQSGVWSKEAQWWLEWMKDPQNLTIIRDEELQDHYGRIALLHLLSTQIAIKHSAWTSATLLPEALNDLTQLAAPPDQPLGFLQDLTQALLPSGAVRPAKTSCTLPVLLVEEAREEERGVVLSLTLERLDEGNGALYPHPDLAFLFRERSFRQSEKNAREAVAYMGLWPLESKEDVRWSLNRWPGGDFLKGPSVGAAFALGLAQLMAKSA